MFGIDDALLIGMLGGGGLGALMNPKNRLAGLASGMAMGAGGAALAPAIGLGGAASGAAGAAGAGNAIPAAAMAELGMPAMSGVAGASTASPAAILAENGITNAGGMSAGVGGLQTSAPATFGAGPQGIGGAAGVNMPQMPAGSPQAGKAAMLSPFQKQALMQSPQMLRSLLGRRRF